MKKVPQIKTSNFFGMELPSIELKKFKQEVFYGPWWEDPLKTSVYGYTLPTIKWDPASNSYIDTDNFQKIKRPQKLRFLTYNIWFDLHNFVARLEALMEEFKNANADFICLQEVLKDSLAFILNSPFIKNNYYVSYVVMDGYFCVMLSKFELKFQEYTFPSGMGRKLLRAVGTFDDGTNFSVNTAHFESLNSAKYRKLQLEKTFKVMSNDNVAVLMGDFNFDWPEEYLNFPKDYDDFWPLIRPKDEGFTMPKTSSFSAWRPDKVLMNKNMFFKPGAIERIGMNPLPLYATVQKTYSDEVTTPSDHYGLVSEIYSIV